MIQGCEVTVEHEQPLVTMEYEATREHEQLSATVWYGAEQGLLHAGGM